MSKTIAERLTKLRDHYQLSDNGLGRIMGVSGVMVGKYVSGESEPGYQTIVRTLTHFKEISQHWLLFGNGNMFDRDSKKKFIEERMDDMENKISGLGQLLPLMKPKSEEAASILAKFLESNPDITMYGTDSNKKKV